MVMKNGFLVLILLKKDTGYWKRSYLCTVFQKEGDTENLRKTL